MNDELIEDTTIIGKLALSELIKAAYAQGWKEASELRQHEPERERISEKNEWYERGLRHGREEVRAALRELLGIELPNG